MSKILKFSRYARSNVLLNRNIYYVRVTICEWLQNCLDVAPSSLDPSVGYILKPSVHEKAAETLIYEKRLKIGQKNCPKDFRNVPKNCPFGTFDPNVGDKKSPAIKCVIMVRILEHRTPEVAAGPKLQGLPFKGSPVTRGQRGPTNLGSSRIFWSKPAKK